PPLPVPSFIWDYFKPYLDVRVIGSARVDGDPTKIVAFVGGTGGTPVWFRLWIDPAGMIRRAMMRAIGHFMDHRYYDFNARFAIPRRTRAATPAMAAAARARPRRQTMQEDLDEFHSSVGILRDINRLRAGAQHTGDAQRRRVQAADRLGVPLDGRWAEAWDRT